MSPADWWECFGSSARHLQRLAIRILSLTCSASGCERNWSAFEQSHSKERNKLNHQKLNDLAYIKYNQKMMERRETEDVTDPINLFDIEDLNEWLLGVFGEGNDNAENELVFDTDDLTCHEIAASAGVELVSEEPEHALAKLGPARLDGRSPPKQIEGPDGRNLQPHFKSKLSRPLFTGGKVEGEQGAAIQEAFIVKDHSGKLYNKHYPPALRDEVWRLEKIGKDGSFHKRLNEAGIFTVEDFLQLVVKDSQRLRNILGSGMSTKMWESLVEHAKTCVLSGCVLSGKHYIYYSEETRSVAAVFNNIYKVAGLIANGQYYAAVCLTDGQKVFMDTLVKKAYDNLAHVIEYDGKALLDHKQNMGASTSPNKVPLVSPRYPASYDQQMSQPQMAQPLLDGGVASGGAFSSGGYNGNLVAAYPSPSQPSTSNINMGASTSPNKVPLVSPSYPASYDQQMSQPQTAQPSLDGGVASGGAISSGGYNGNLVAAYPSPSQPSTSYINMQFPSYILPQFTRNDSATLALPQHQSLDFQPTGQLPQPSYNDFFSSEEEIRMRSHGMLENDDMQRLLRACSAGGNNSQDDGCGFPSFMPSTPDPS